MITAALLAVVLFLATPGTVLADGPDVDPAVITPPRVSYVDGQVSYWRPGSEDWIPAPLNMALAPGDELHTGRPGNVELQVDARAFVRAWGETQFGLVAQTPDLLHFKVTDGHLALDVRALEPGRLIRIDAPGATFTVDRPGYHRVDVDIMPPRVAFTTRRDGSATTTRVEGGVTQTVMAGEPDVWDRWNQARTDEVLASQSARYLPEGVYGQHDLDAYGDWRVLPTYGAVWVPRGSPAGWAPYTTGRWFWDARFGWTWVDAAPWGWAPYHHGRWVYLDGVWAWAPGPVVARPVYAPALVAFFRAPGVRVTVGTPFVSWVALGWGEPVVPWWGRPGFVGRPVWAGWGGPRVVNNVVVQKTTIVNVTDIRVYRNTNVHRAVVAVRPERFGRARVQDVRVADVDTRRLQPVRGPLTGLPDSARRGEPAVRAERPRDGERPRAEAPRPRGDAAPAAPRAERDGAPRRFQREGAVTPRGDEPRPQPAPRVEAPRRQSPRVDEPRPQPAPRVEAPRPQPAPRAEGPRAQPAPRVEAPRPQPAPGLEGPRPQPAPRAEAPRPQPAPRAEEPRQPRGRFDDDVRRADPGPRVEPPRPDLRPRSERRGGVQRAGDHPSASVREQRAPRGPRADGPALRGAGARDGQDRGRGPQRAR
jgi:hypothetical protein